MILLIDSYDSFSNNLIQLIASSTGKEVIRLFNNSVEPNEYLTFAQKYLKLFEYIVIGPGPGHPSFDKDIGIIGWLLKHCRQQNNIIPILGVCLGFQCLCQEFGCVVKPLESIQHGQIYRVHPVFHEKYNNELYPMHLQRQEGILCVRYHSLFVENIENSSMVPLAYCNEHFPENYQILMAAKHRTLPFYGVQYHPESVLSDDGHILLKAFDSLAQEFNRNNNRLIVEEERDNLKAKFFKRMDKWGIIGKTLLNPSKGLHDATDFQIHIKELNLGSFSSSKFYPIGICDYLRKNSSHFFLLNSAAPPGKWSIIALPIENYSFVLTHSMDKRNEVSISEFASKESSKIVLEEGKTVWNYLREKMQELYVPLDVIDKKINGFNAKAFPFFGGLLGFIAYEEGHHIRLDKRPPVTQNDTPDLKLIHIERFLLLENDTGKCYLVSTGHRNDQIEWISLLSESLERAAHDGSISFNSDSLPKSVQSLLKEGDHLDFEFPDRDIYKEQFNLCQKHLHSGDSYELCLTTRAKITVPNYIDPWDVYKILTVHKNPAPYSSFFDFTDCFLISSSPEKFLSWDFDPDFNDNRIFEYRPIKGTLKKDDAMSFSKAQEILSTPKEKAENLMIVDLIRHDLHLLVDNVSVPQLLTVEEYETVYQLVSVVQGTVSRNKVTGIDILEKSLPPGSMTGAPKKRSVELLHGIESIQQTDSTAARRGIYSGVAGFWSVTDVSNWSVIIRSIYHYRNDRANSHNNSIWRIGAGGAITVLSQEESEWEEMMLKFSSALSVFK